MKAKLVAIVNLFAWLSLAALLALALHSARCRLRALYALNTLPLALGRWPLPAPSPLWPSPVVAARRQGQAHPHCVDMVWKGHRCAV